MYTCLRSLSMDVRSFFRHNLYFFSTAPNEAAEVVSNEHPIITLESGSMLRLHQEYFEKKEGLRNEGLLDSIIVCQDRQKDHVVHLDLEVQADLPHHEAGCEP